MVSFSCAFIGARDCIDLGRVVIEGLYEAGPPIEGYSGSKPLLSSRLKCERVGCRTHTAGVYYLGEVS